MMMLGTLGESDRMEGSVISDAVNIAARLEGLTKLYKTPLLISGETLLKIDDSIIEYIVDESFERQGRFIPGMHIPIVGPKKLKVDNPDYAILFAYNYFDEVMKKETDFIKKGGKFIVPLPEPKIIES